MPCSTRHLLDHVAAPSSAEPTDLALGATPHDVALVRLFTRLASAITLPPVASRMLKVASQSASGPRDMHRAIQLDPVMAAHILRRVNTSHYGITHRVVDLLSAIRLVGIPEIRNIGMSIFVARLFDQTGEFHGYSRENLWRHCCGVAFAARKIARMTGAVSLDEAYITGLLHHTGTIILDEQMRSHFRKVVRQLNGTTRTCDVERLVYSFDQSQLSAFIADRWRLPATITDAIRYYHYPQEYGGAHLQHVSLLAVADYLCNRVGRTAMGVRSVHVPPDIAFTSLGLTKVQLAILWGELKTSLNESLLEL